MVQRPRKTLRILVVDDDPDSAATMAAVLQTVGHDVQMVTDGTQAAEVAWEFHPDVVLLDLRMPGIDGYEVARRIRDQGDQTLVVAVTGFTRDDRLFQDAGFDHYMTKPIDLDDLSKWLNEVAAREA